MQKWKTVIYFLVIVVYIYAFSVLLISKARLTVELEDDSEDSFDLIPLSDAPVPSLSRLASLTPPAPPPPQCSAPRLPRLPSCRGQPGLTGAQLATPRRLVLMLLFSFEVDTLEIALREQQDLLDKIFIVEATTTTKGVSLIFYLGKILEQTIPGSETIAVGKTDV